MKTKFDKLIPILLAITLAAVLITESALASEILPTDPDFGFSHDIKHYPVGSKVVLLFQADSMIIGKARFGVSTDNIDANIEALSKFLKWAELAQQRGDELTKEIGTARGFNYGLFDFWNKYEFQTNKTSAGVSYLLCIQPGNKLFGIFKPKSVDDNTQAGGPIDFKMYFSQTQVRQIIQRMRDFQAGNLKDKEEISADYK